MAGYPPTGVQGAVTSYSGTLYAYLIARLVETQANLSISAPPENVTGLGASVESYIEGLGSWEGVLTGHGFASPQLGNKSLVAFSDSSYNLHVDSWAMRLTAGVEKITGLNPSPPQWERFCPLQSTWAMTIRARHDTGTAAPLPDLSGITGDAVSRPTVTLTYGDGATLAGSMIRRRTASTIRVGGVSMVEFEIQGTGALTAAGANSIFYSGSTAFGVPEWDQATSFPTSTTQPSLVVTVSSGKTWTGCCFWKEINVSGSVRTPIALSMAVQGTGPIVPA